MCGRVVVVCGYKERLDRRFNQFIALRQRIVTILRQCKSVYSELSFFASKEKQHVEGALLRTRFVLSKCYKRNAKLMDVLQRKQHNVGRFFRIGNSVAKSSCVKKDYDGGYFASAKLHVKGVFSERNDMLWGIFDEELSCVVCGEFRTKWLMVRFSYLKFIAMGTLRRCITS